MTVKDLMNFLNVVSPDTQVAFRTFHQPLTLETFELENHPCLCFDGKTGKTSNKLETELTFILS